MNPARPQGVDSRYSSQMITPADQLAIAAKDEAEQAGGAALLLKYLLNSVKELSGELRRLNNLYPCCSAGGVGGCVLREDELATIRNLSREKPADNSSSQRVGDRLKTRQNNDKQQKKRL